MNNIQRKKLVRRLTKSSVKEFPLANLYILVLIVMGVFVELADNVLLKWLYRPLAIGLMVYYIHHKASVLDYLTCNLTEVALVFAIAGNCLMLYGEEETAAIQRAVAMMGWLLYVAVFSMKQPIGKSSFVGKLVIWGSCIIVVGVQILVTYWLWYTEYRNLWARIVLTLLLLLAILRYNNTSPRSYLFFCISASLFVLSELGCTALRYFGSESVLCDVLEGPIVVLGHYLIMHGSILHCNLQDAIDRLKSRSVY